MPIYEFKCNCCNKTFEQIVLTSDNENNVECPFCEKKDVCKLVSAFSCGPNAQKSSMTSNESAGCNSKSGFS